MPKKILINGITLESANIVPLLLKVKYWQEKNMEVSFFGNVMLKKQIDALHIIKPYNFIELENTGRIKGRIHLIFEGLRRNLQALSYIRRFKNKFDVVYSISSVLDLMIFPYILQRFDKKIVRVAVFDNIVPITDPGNKFIRFLAWIFFRISLVLLISADQVFTGSKDLENFLITRGIDKKKIIERGQAVRNDFITKARKNSKYDIDALFIGRINETKGIYDMLEVLDTVRKKYPNFKLEIIGTGEKTTMRRYKQRIKEMKLGNNVRFLGNVSEEEKFTIIKSSRVFWFLPVSESESWGVALLEAVCCGKPAFAYDLPAYKYYKNNEVFLFKLHDHQSVAAKVIEVFDRQDFDNKKGRLLIGKYSWERIADIELENMFPYLLGIPKAKNMIINGITLEGANLIPLLSKIKYWQNKGVKVTIFGNETLRKQINSLAIIKKYDFLLIKKTMIIRSKIDLIFEGARRNFQALSHMRKMKNRYDTVYSISSVLDLVIFPYFLTKIDKKIKWAAVFDNTVPFIYLGNIFIRLLAWFFYQFSLLLLKDADYLFAVRPELKKYMVNKGFDQNRLIVTGNAIEIGFIKSAKRGGKYNIDALFVGRINEMKGIYDMLEVLKRVIIKYPDFQLALMGTGDMQTTITYRKKIEVMGLTSNIQFLGYKTGQEKFNIMKSSKCFWFFSYTESYPVAPLEAVCCGLNAFVYDLEAYHMYKNNEMIIVKKRNYEMLAEKVTKMFELRDFENKAGKKLFDKISWSWDEIAKLEYKTLFSN